MDRGGRSTNLGDEEDESEAADLKAEEAAVRVIKEATEDEAKEIEINLKMVLTKATQPGGMGKNNVCDSATTLINVY